MLTSFIKKVSHKNLFVSKIFWKIKEKNGKQIKNVTGKNTKLIILKPHFLKLGDNKEKEMITCIYSC